MGNNKLHKKWGQNKWMDFNSMQRVKNERESSYVMISANNSTLYILNSLMTYRARLNLKILMFIFEEYQFISTK